MRPNKFALAGHAENHAAGAQEFFFQHGEDALAQRRVLDQPGIVAGDAEIGFGHAQFHVAEEFREHRKSARDLAQKLLMPGTALRELLQRMAHAEPGGDGVTALHPAEDPGNGA